MASIAAPVAGSMPAYRSARGADVLVLAMLALLVVAVRGIWLGDPVAAGDEQVHSFIGQRMLAGELPYSDWSSREPFGIFAVFAFSHWIGGPGPLAYQSFAAIASFCGAVLTYALVRPLADRKGAAIAGALYVMLCVAYSGHSAQAATFQAPLMLAALWLVRDPAHHREFARAMAAMALCGLALQVRYSALPQCMLLAVWTLWTMHRRGARPGALVVRSGIFAALLLAPTVLVCGFYLANGGWDAFWSAASASLHDPVAPGSVPFELANLALLLPLALLLAGGFFSALRVAPPRDRPIHRFHAAWFAVAAWELTGGGTAALAVLVPPAILLATPLFDRRGISGLLPAASLVALTAHCLALPAGYEASLANRAQMARFAGAVAPHVDAAGDCLYVIEGPVALHSLTNACVPGETGEGIAPRSVEAKRAGAEEVQAMLAQRPAVLVTTSTPIEVQDMQGLVLVGETIRAHYQPLASAELGERRYHAWLRRER